VLTWRPCRYEGELRYRPLDLEEATAIARHTAVQNGTQGMFDIRIVLCSFVSPFPIPFTLGPHVTALPLFLPCFADLADSNVGEVGKRPHAVCWHVTRGKCHLHALHNTVLANLFTRLAFSTHILCFIYNVACAMLTRNRSTM
jgi:hypothetical protein